jgi:hypothetical protein
LIAERADASKPNMGLTSWDGERIRKSDVSKAKNYLTEQELLGLNLLVDQYLSFAEFQAMQRKVMHMGDWIRKLDDFLRLNERDILSHAGKIKAQMSKDFAEHEYEKYSMRQKAMGNDVSDFDRYVRRIESERSAKN